MSKLQCKQPVPSDIAISQTLVENGLPPITDIASSIGIDSDFLHPWGPHKAKVSLRTIDQEKSVRNLSEDANYVVVTGINPTPLGEGKSTTTLGLAQSLSATLKKSCIACIRQPSQGPTFGIKGGAAGGGYSQVVPMDEFNLHLTGDVHAVGAATNLLAAALETRMFHEASQTDEALFRRLVLDKGYFSPVMKRRLKKLGIGVDSNPEDLTEAERTRFSRLDIDPATITWHRVLDVCDRHLREVRVGIGSKETVRDKSDEGELKSRRIQHDRDTGFDITVASEVMAVLALSTSLSNMRERLGAMVVGYSRARETVTADDLGCGGALAVLMKDAILPTLMQSAEATPVLVHAGPFANIATGNSSIIADIVGLNLVNKDNGFVVTEAGFGADIGMEKFFNIKCRVSGLLPKCAVIVATVRALKMHGGGAPVKAGQPLPLEYVQENTELLTKGVCNLQKHIENARKFGVKVIVAINKFHTDTEAEICIVRKAALDAGADDACLSNHWAEGGEGARLLATAVVKACENQKADDFKLLYEDALSIKEKIAKISLEIYGADGVVFSDLAERQIDQYSKSGFGSLPICMAKTQYSFSCDASAKGVPKGFKITVREVRSCAGAGFLYPICGEIMTIPGLPTRPGFFDVDLDEAGNVVGLF